jgi:protocatechuate 3,4-dioxygenase beta subunit
MRRAKRCYQICLLGIFIGASVAAAGQPARDRREAPTGKGVIRGRVVRADTGQPLRRVQVRIDEWSAGDAGGPSATMTDADGRYALTELPAGRFQLKASRGGYVEVSYGQRRPFERGRPIELAEGEVLENIDFALPSGAVVAGRIVDEAGDPVPHVSVSLARRQYIEGARRLVSQIAGTTDDRGEFRVFGVPPGEYFLLARFDAGGFGGRDTVRYVPTYYPGTALVGEAQRIAVAIGEEISGITIPLARARTATVRGILRAGDGVLPPFTFVTAREADAAHAYGEGASAVAGGDGSFVLTGLLPGTYAVEARSPIGREFASADVTVHSADVGGLSLILSKGVTARGRIRFDTGMPPQGLRPSQVLLMSSLVDRPMTAAAGGPPAVADDWSFEVQGLRGRGFIRAATLGDWQMKSVRLEGNDVTDMPLDFGADIEDLEIELTGRLTTVSGVVTDDRGAATVDGTIVVFADDPDKWGAQSRFIESARPDQQGRYTVRGLPPGRYRAIAVGYLEPGEERDPELLESWREAATAFTLTEGETRTLDLILSAT